MGIQSFLKRFSSTRFSRRSKSTRSTLWLRYRSSTLMFQRVHQFFSACHIFVLHFILIFKWRLLHCTTQSSCVFCNPTLRLLLPFGIAFKASFFQCLPAVPGTRSASPNPSVIIHYLLQFGASITSAIFSGHNEFNMKCA